MALAVYGWSLSSPDSWNVDGLHDHGHSFLAEDSMEM
jgi:hypothetical protein